MDPAAVDDALDRLELAVYVALDGVADSARRIASASVDSPRGWWTTARARLVDTDVLSRRGELLEALASQRHIAEEARERGASAIEARANCLLASTYWRLGLFGESVGAAELAVSLLGERCPAHWPAEHYMVLALFTSYDRVGTVDFGLFEEALRRARRHGDPTLILAVLNNYAYTAAQREDELARAVVLVDEMETLGGHDPAVSSLAVIDTVAWVRLADGQVDRAQELLEAALTHGANVEPDDEATVLVHLAGVQRARGEDAAAARLLERARAAPMAAGSSEVSIEALRELAEIDAARGDFRSAYERMTQFVAERDAAERTEAERRSIALQALHGIELERDRRRHYQLLAASDDLTGLYNRRHLETEVPRLLETGSIAVVLVDIDHFKSINDRFSHGVGDQVLDGLARLLEQTSAQVPDGFAARLGGEEFLMALPAADTATAPDAAERLRHAVAQHRWPALPEDVRVTVSCGVAVSGTDGTDLSQLLATADRRLYAAKHAGRNRTVATG